MEEHTAVRESPRARATRQSAVDRAYEQIKSEILSNQLRPGQTVPIERFIQDLSLSRTPVRDAVMRLQREGLVEIRPRLGTFVAQLDLVAVRDMFRVRGALEGEAARQAATRIPEHELSAVCSMVRSVNAADPKAVSQSGQELRGAILRYCGNEVLRRMNRSLDDQFARTRRLTALSAEGAALRHQEHLAIAEALLARWPEGAQKAVQRHFEGSAQALIENLSRGFAGHDSATA